MIRWVRNTHAPKGVCVVHPSNHTASVAGNLPLAIPQTRRELDLALACVAQSKVQGNSGSDMSDVGASIFNTVVQRAEHAGDQSLQALTTGQKMQRGCEQGHMRATREEYYGTVVGGQQPQAMVVVPPETVAPVQVVPVKKSVPAAAASRSTPQRERPPRKYAARGPVQNNAAYVKSHPVTLAEVPEMSGSRAYQYLLQMAAEGVDDAGKVSRPGSTALRKAELERVLRVTPSQSWSSASAPGRGS